MKTRVVKKASTPVKGMEEEATQETSSPIKGVVVEEPAKPSSQAPKIKKVIVKKRVVSKSAVPAEFSQAAILDSSSLANDEGLKDVEPSVIRGQANPPEEGLEVGQATQAPAGSVSGKKVKKIVVIKKIVRRKRESVTAANPSVIREEGAQCAGLDEGALDLEAETGLDGPQDASDGGALESDAPKELNEQQDAVAEIEDQKLSAVGTQVPEKAPASKREDVPMTEIVSASMMAEIAADNSVEVKVSEQLEQDQSRPGDEKPEHLQEELADVNEGDHVLDEEEYEDLNEEMEGEYDLEVAQGDQQEGEEEVGADEHDDIADFALEYPEAQQVMPVSKKQKSRKFEVFVGGLNKDATDEDIKKAFEAIGDVTEVRLIRNPQTGKNKGYAFVRFASVAQAKRAATEFERIEVRGRECGILPNEENDILFVGNVNKTWTKDQLEGTLKKHGVENIEELTLMEDPHNEGVNRGFAFIEFVTHRDALNAFDLLRQSNMFLGTDRYAKIAWAEPFNDPDEDVMAQVKSVFVEGLPSTWDEERVNSTFGKYGEISRVVLSRHMPYARRNDFGFVNYGTREAALACIEDMGSTEFVEGDSKVKLKVTLAKPPPKNKASRGAAWSEEIVGRHSSHFGIRGFYRGGRSLDGWGRGAGRFWFPRAGLRGGRGYSRGFSRGGRFMASYGDHYRSEDEKSRVKELLRVLREQATQEDGPSSSQKATGQQGQSAQVQSRSNSGKPGNLEHVSGSTENQGSKAAVEKYHCHMCGFGSDVESDYSKHISSRVHKVIEEIRGDDNVTNKTPISLLHEYAARHHCEVHYDIRADDPLGPFEVLATIGGGGTGVPLTKGVAKGSNKSKARQIAAADALEKIMERVPDLQFGRAYRPKQVVGDGPFGAGSRGRSFRGGRGRGYSRGDTFEARHDARRMGLESYGYDERMFDDSAPFRVRSRGSHHPRGPDLFEEEFLGDDHDTGMRGPIEFNLRGKKRIPGRGQPRERYGPSGDYPESFRRERERSDERNALAAHREAYLQRLGGRPGYDSRTAIREYGEAMPLGKRPYSVLEEDGFIDSQRGNLRARMEHIEPFPGQSGTSQYAGGALYGTSSSYIGGPVTQAAAYGLYDGHLTGVDVSGVYVGTGDYGGSLELAGASSYPSSMYDIYAQTPSVAGGFPMSGAGSGTLF